MKYMKTQPHAPALVPPLHARSNRREEEQPSALLKITACFRRRIRIAAALRLAVWAALALASGAQAAGSFTTQPQSPAVLVGDQAVFTVLATGSGTLTYQWRKNGAPIGGATASALILNPVAFTDAGSYTVDVSDAAPSTATSSAAGLSVNSARGGDVDPTFGGGFISSSVQAMAMQSDGKVLIGGEFIAV